MHPAKNSPASFVIKNCKPFKLYLGIHLFVIIYGAIDISLWPYISKLLINSVADSPRDMVIANTTPLALVLIIFTFLPNFIWRLSDYAWMNMAPALKKKITVENSALVMRHSNNFFQNNFTGALANRIRDLAHATHHLIDIFIYNFLHCFLSLVIAFFTLFTIHKFFAFGILAWGILFTLMAAKSAKSTAAMSGDIANQSSKITGNIVDSLGNIANIKFFTNASLEQRRLELLQDDYTVLSKKRNWFLLKFYTIHGITFSIYFAFCTALLIWLYARNQVTLGDFAMIFTINNWMIHAMWQTANQMRVFLEEWGTLQQALQIVNEPIEIEDCVDAKTLTIATASPDAAIIRGDNKKTSTRFGGEIIFENVNFSYKIKSPSSEIKAANWELIGMSQSPTPLGFTSEADDKKTFFNNLSIKIKAGEKIGLVGQSGGGKSTFVNLILRQFDINSGRILIDEQNISQVTQESLRAAIGIIPQDPTLFHRSLHENIAYAKNGASDLEIIDSATKAHAHEFIKTLAQGYDSLVGERGVKLSGGQRQRIAIARAFLKNAPILILDEATSQLDSITENLIQDSLELLTKNKTSIIIAHRLSTLQTVDRILVFDNGKIVEDGSHLELLARNGFYKKLWDAQVGGFLVEQ